MADSRQKWLPHSPYSLTEALTDYHINLLLKNWLANKVYDDLNDLDDLLVGVKE